MLTFLLLDVERANAVPAPPLDTGSGLFDTAADCIGVSVTDTAPDAGAVNVPVDVRPTITFDGGCGALELTIALTNAATNEVLASMQYAVPATLPATTTLVPPAPLPYGTELVLSATDNYFGVYTSVPFTTADADLPPLRGTLAVEVIDASFVAGAVSDDLSATVRVTAIDDPSGLSHVELSGPHGDGTYAPGALTEPLVLQWTGIAPAEVCFEAVQIDGRGGQIGPARDCATLALPEAAGCGCDGTRTPIGLGALALLFVARRRRG